MRDSKSWVDRGLEGAMRDILASSRLGYCVVGDDVAGYHGPEPIPANLYIRWAQFAAFTGLFLNGGHGERALWKRSAEELQIIRTFSWLHTELVPYMYTHVVQCHEGGPSLIRPVKGEHHYLFGGDLLVAPIYRDELMNTVVLPAGRWRYLFHDTEALDGPATFSREFPLHEFPVYVRDGAIVPLDVSRAYTGFGDSDSAGYLTIAVYPAGTSQLTVHHPDRSGSTHVRVTAGPPLTVSLTGVRKPHILRILTPTEPKEIKLDGTTLTQGPEWSYDAATKRLIVRTKSYERGEYTVIQ
jgi:alpha-glucosidase (family GH31 glycosyl hydrolase)